MRKLELLPIDERARIAEQALIQFKKTVKSELKPFLSYWTNGEKHLGCIVWLNEDEVKKSNEGIYGTKEGMYLIETCPDETEICIFLPKITETYEDVYNSFIDLYENNETLYVETIPLCVDIAYDGVDKVELSFAVDIEDYDGDVYKSAKTIAEDMCTMLSKSATSDTIAYEDEREKYGNYNAHHIGVKICYDLSDLQIN